MALGIKPTPAIYNQTKWWTVIPEPCILRWALTQVPGFCYVMWGGGIISCRGEDSNMAMGQLTWRIWGKSGQYPNAPSPLDFS